MKNIKRKLKIILSGKTSLFGKMSRLRRFELLRKGKSVFDPCYTKKELEYLYP
jgi:hypothetical protein